MKKLLLSFIALSCLAFTVPGCADSDGCADLAAKINSCNPAHVYLGCTDDAVAACTAEKLDATCSNREAAAQECANK